MTIDASVVRTVVVGGCEIAYRSTGDPAAPTVVLIHGGSAHSGWWSGVVPLLAAQYHVVQPDLCGHGASGHRTEYGADVWAGDIAGVIAAVGGAPATLVGHSMGGLVAIATAARHPDLVASLVLVDTRLPLHGLPRPPARVRFFASADDAFGRFRMSPPETTADAARLRALAAQNLCETADGWRWRFDPNVRRRFTNEGVALDLSRLSIPVGYVFGEWSDVGGLASAQALSEMLGRRAPTSVVKGAFHHVPVDQPAGCAETIDELLTGVLREPHAG